jgi:hypothetical protein
MEIILPEKKENVRNWKRVKPYTYTKKKADFTLKSGKFAIAKQQGMTDANAARFAGLGSTDNSTKMKETQNYKLCMETFKDAYLGQTTVERIVGLSIRNMEQDKDIGGSNAAIKIAMDKIEPEDKPQQAQMIQVTFE